MSFYLLLFSCNAAFSQSFSQNDHQAVYDLYMQSVGKSARIFTGSAYTTRYPAVKGSPFFLDAGLTPGNLSYGGILYYQVPIRFDLVTQELIVYTDDQHGIILPTEKIDSFEMGGHVFIRLQPDSLTNSGIKYGFYERLYKGLFVYRNRVVHKALRAEDLSYFDVYDSYFFQTKTGYHVFSGERGLRKLLGLTRQQMASDKNGKRLNWKRDPENAMRAAVETYDLSTSP